ncbi:hypothetical protein ZOSMA_789G00040 [Zostera marina]|uniref:Uncharacterized protein n=1 Tax=Zostera marina TaxID=29655 RepID=A0A0K9NNJ0_ZOSMR|nr:hypothetical protein ZOSMA_789G00040 [Zostera marina]
MDVPWFEQDQKNIDGLDDNDTAGQPLVIDVSMKG